MSKANEELNLESFTLQELSNLRKKLEEDLSIILDSFNSFKYLFKKFEDGKLIVNNLAKQETRPLEVLVPMSSSLYLPGEISDPNKFVVDLGTGYFAERSAKQTVEYCDQTLAVIRENGDRMAKEINKKQELRDRVNIQFQKKYQQQLAHQQSGAGAGQQASQ